MSDTFDPAEPYAEPFFQTILLTTAPIDAVGARIIVDTATSSMARLKNEDGSPRRAMVCMAPLRHRVSLPDWKPLTLQNTLDVVTEADPGEVPPLEAVTGGPDATVDELRTRMHELIMEGNDLLDNARDALAEENSLFGAREKLQAALSAWTTAEMINIRLYSEQFRLQARKADPEVDRA